jgi:hydroxypyruvate isomerase
MLKFSANLTMLFNEVDFINRFALASRAGFKGVEFMFPYDWDKHLLAGELNSLGLEVVLHNFPAGNWSNGERGIACLPDRVGEFQKSVEQAIEYAKALKCPGLNCMAGLAPKNMAREKILQTFIDNLKFAAGALAKEGIRLMIEPINNRDMPGFYLNNTLQALEVMKAVDHPNIWLQYDIYHMQVMEGNLTLTITENISKIGHIQIADNPGRHEPGTGEINFNNLFHFIEKSGYNGWIGCEYKPIGSTEDSLKWLRSYREKGVNNG